MALILALAFVISTICWSGIKSLHGFLSSFRSFKLDRFVRLLSSSCGQVESDTTTQLIMPPSGTKKCRKAGLLQHVLSLRCLHEVVTNRAGIALFFFSLGYHYVWCCMCHLCVRACVRAFMPACVHQREREKVRETEKVKERETEGEGGDTQGRTKDRRRRERQREKDRERQRHTERDRERERERDRHRDREKVRERERAIAREKERECEGRRESEKKHVGHILCYKMYKTLLGMKHHTQSQSTFTFYLIKPYQPFSQTRTSPGIDLPSSLCVGQSDIPLRNFGVIFDNQLALKEQENKRCQLAYLEIRRIGSIPSKSPKLSFRLLFSPGLITVLLSLLALLRFS